MSAESSGSSFYLRYKRGWRGWRIAEGETFAACMFPREDYSPEMAIGSYIAEHSSAIPVSLLRDEAWTLEDPRIQRLLERIRSAGVPLKNLYDGSLYRGPVTGLNEAFFIDVTTRIQLIAEDKRSTDLIRPLLRGRDIDRWRPRHSDGFIIFTRRGTDIEKYPAIKRHLSKYRNALEKRAGEQAWYELQASPSDDATRLMLLPKILYQEIQFHSWFSLDTTGACLNNKVFMLPSSDLALLGVLSSSLMWWYLTRTLPHMKDEALCPAGFLMEELRVTTGTEAQADAIRKVVQKLIELADVLHDWQDRLIEQVCDAIGLEKPDTRIVNWVALSENVFISRIAKLAGRKLPDDLAARLEVIRAREHARQLEIFSEQFELEKTLATLVEDAFALTVEERGLLQATKPVRDPLDVLAAKLVGKLDVALYE